MTDQRRSGRSLKRLAFLAVLLGAMVAVLYPVVRSARRAARRTEHANNLKCIGIALHNFHDSYKQFPPAVHRDDLGRPISSWRFHLVPFLESIMSIDFDSSEPWDAPINQWITSHPFHAYCLYPGTSTELGTGTNFMAVTGPGTAFEERRVCRFGNVNSNTILVVEVPTSDVHWAEPGDLDIDHLPDNLTEGPEGDGFHVLFADGTVWFLRTEAPLAEVKKFFTIEGSKQYDREVVLKPYTVPE